MFQQPFPAINQGINRAYNFDGVNDYISIPDHNDFSFGDGSTDSPFSLLAAIYLTADTTTPIICKRVSTGTAEWALDVLTGGILRYQISDNTVSHRLTAESTAGSLSLNTWHYVAATYDGAGGLKVYVDGVNVTDSTVPTGTYVAMHNESSDVTIGVQYRDQSAFRSYLQGQLKDVSVYSKELTQAEILFAQSGGRVGTDPTDVNLVANWLCTDQHATTAPDHSGNGHNGAKTNIDTADFHYASIGVPD